MCASSLSQAPGISIEAESTVPELLNSKARRKLNPLADTFVSSRSESETSSVGDEREEEVHPTAEPQHPPNPDFDTESSMDGRHPGPNDVPHYGGYGWESPQGVLPGGHDGPPRAASPPPPPGAYYPWPPAFYYPLPDRGASPPPPPGMVFPAGSSPPLAPGFISIPVGHGHPPPHPHTHPPSLGSSPPTGGHYLYIPPPGPAPHPQHAQHVQPADVQRGMAAMTIEGGSPRSVGSAGSGRTRASARIARSHRAGGAYNPSDFEFKPADEGGDASKTAVMIRNIPNKYTQAVVLDLLEDAGLGGTFDFIYVPIDYRSRAGLGYAFVNFVSHEAACAAWRRFHGRRWDEFQSQKVCQVTYARVQGREALVEHFKTAKFPSTDAEFCPLVYAHEREGGVIVRAHSAQPIHKYLARLAEVEVVGEEAAEETGDEDKN